MKLTHYSDDKLSLADLYDVEQKEQTPNFKPMGLWVSDDDHFGWADWCRAEDFNLKPLKHRVEVDLTRILLLRRKEEVLGLARRYKALPFSEDSLFEYVNWKLVAEDYDGVIITPYSKKWLWDSSIWAIWVDGWDCAGGCIWRKRAVKEIVYVGKEEAVEE